MVSYTRKLRRLTCKIPRYFNGIGTDKPRLDKFNDGITGDGCAEQIREVFTVSRIRKEKPLLVLRSDKFCCRQVQSEKDEVWLFGFSRGACECLDASCSCLGISLMR